MLSDLLGELVPVLAILCTIGLPVSFGFMLWLTAIKSKHTEKMAMIEKELLWEDVQPERKPNRYASLRNGLLMIGISLGVIIGMVIDNNLACGMESDWMMLIVPAVTIFFGGLAFVFYFFLSRSLMEKEQREDEKK